MNCSSPFLSRSYDILDGNNMCATTLEFDIIQFSSRWVKLDGFGRFFCNLAGFVASENACWRSRVWECKIPVLQWDRQFCMAVRLSLDKHTITRPETWAWVMRGSGDFSEGDAGCRLSFNSEARRQRFLQGHCLWHPAELCGPMTLIPNHEDNHSTLIILAL